MYASIAAMVPGATRDKWKEDAREVDTLLQVLKSSISSGNTTAMTTIQAEADQIVSYYDIDTSM